MRAPHPRALSTSSSGVSHPFSPEAFRILLLLTASGTCSFPSPRRAERRWRNAPDEGQAERLIRVLATVRIKPYAKEAPHPAFGHPLPAQRGEGSGHRHKTASPLGPCAQCMHRLKFRTGSKRRRIRPCRSFCSGTYPTSRVQGRTRPATLPSRTNRLGSGDARRTPSGCYSASKPTFVRFRPTARHANRLAAAHRSRPSRNANTARTRRRSRFRSVRMSKASSFRILMRRNRGFAS